MKILIVGASKGLGRALVEGLGQDAELIVGVSRKAPRDLAVAPTCALRWIEADLSDPEAAAARIAAEAPAELDVIIHNVGIWEDKAFGPDYDFLKDAPAQIARLLDVNITGTILLLQRLIPRLLGGARPQLVLTGSTSGLPRSGRPEVAFGASKAALSGIADALRESFRAQRLAVTCLQLGYLNTEDGLATPRDTASRRGDGSLAPVHDVVAMVRALLSLSDASFVRELVLPAILDERY